MKSKILLSLQVQIIFSILIMASCTSYVWNPINYSDLETRFDQQVGSDFSQAYARHGDEYLYSETDTHSEYIYDKHSHCSWIVKVIKISNKIEAWRYSYPERCEKYKRNSK